MNATTISIGITLILAAIGGWYLLNNTPLAVMPSNNDATAVDQNSNEVHAEAVATSSGSSFKSSIASIMTRRGNYQCVVINEDMVDGVPVTSKGVLYASSGRSRSDFIATKNNIETKISMITDADWVYSWSFINTQGMKMRAVKNMDTENNGTSTPLQTGTMPEYLWDCKEWEVDESVFTPPADVSFTEIG